MNKKYILLWIIIGLCFITSCGKKEDKKDNEPIKQDTVQICPAEKAKLEVIDKINLVVVDNDLVLPTQYEDVLIEWTSSDEKAVDNTGNVLLRKSTISEHVMYYSLTEINTNRILDGEITLKIYPKTFDAVYNLAKKAIPDEIFEDIVGLEDTYAKYYSVEMISGDTSIISNDGKFTKPLTKCEITMQLKISVSDGVSKTFDFTIKAMPTSPEERVNIVEAWLKEVAISERSLTEDIFLPTIESETELEITWTTSNPEIVETNGTIHPTVYDRYALLTAKFKSGSIAQSIDFDVKIEAIDISKMDEYEVLELFVDSIAVKSLKRVFFSAYSDINKSYNFIDFFDNEFETHIEQICSGKNGNRPGTKKSSTEFIVVHDTANNGSSAGAKTHANFVEQGGNGASYSYVIGNDGIYHLIPDDEVSWHAGDGTKYDAKLYDTGVKALTKFANITISSDGYFKFNGVKSKIAIPAGANQYSTICSSGLFYEIGANGNYWLNENYYNTDYHYIANRGGNNNSIGMETCVNAGTDYLITVRYTIDLISQLLIDNNLSVDRVMQHNNFSGKPCPNAIRVAKYWQTFKDYISMETFGMKFFKDYSFEWHSNSNILNDQGYIISNINGAKSVSYSLVVKKNAQVVMNESFVTNLDY